MAKVSQRQVTAKIAPHAGQSAQIVGNLPKFETFVFAQVSGGEITASVEKIYEGGKASPTVLCAPFDIGDITLTAHFDDDLVPSDLATGLQAKIKELRKYVGKAYYDVTVELRDCDLVVKGTDRLYSKALLVGLTEPDGDSSSGAPSTFALTFSVSTVV